MVRVALLAGVTLWTAAACGGAPAASTPVPSTAGVTDAVRAACGTPVPGVIDTALPAATPRYTAHYALGSSCQWQADDLSKRALAVAVTTVPYAGWRRTHAMLTDQTNVAGHAAVRGRVEDACVVLVDVDEVPLEVDLTGVPDPACRTTAELAGQILAGH